MSGRSGVQPYASTTALVSTVLLTGLQGTHGLLERSRKQLPWIGNNAHLLTSVGSVQTGLHALPPTSRSFA